MKAAAQAEQASSTLAPVGGEEEEEEEASIDPPLVNPQPAPSQIEAAADAMQPEPEAAASSPGKQSFPATESKQEDRRMGEDGDQATIRGSSPKILPPDGETTAEGNGILAEAHAREANGDEENQGDGRISDLAPRRTSQAMKPPLQVRILHLLSDLLIFRSELVKASSRHSSGELCCQSGSSSFGFEGEEAEPLHPFEMAAGVRTSSRCVVTFFLDPEKP